MFYNLLLRMTYYAAKGNSIFSFYPTYLPTAISYDSIFKKDGLKLCASKKIEQFQDFHTKNFPRIFLCRIF